jgi:myo-inositol-1(or 4)-monophosphatase
MEIAPIILETAIQAARAAGQILVERWKGQREIHAKGLRDIVTDADLAAEEMIIQTIRARFPDHALLTEEAGESSRDVPYVWVVDPLDGTTNYSRRFPVFSVSISLVYQEQLTVGVVYDPLSDSLFAAQRGRGATLNGVPLRVSRVERMIDALVGLDWARAHDQRQEIMTRLDRIAPACCAVRSTGSAALGLCYVAAGWLDAYFHAALQPWDLAAGLLLIREAGGRVTDIQGHAWQPWVPSVLVSNGRLHQALLDLMDGAPQT